MTQEHKELVKQYMIPYVGVYNAEIYVCPYCGKNILHDFYKHVIGFANAPIGFVKITECPECFEKYYSHCGMNDIDRFLDYLEDGLNIHHKV